MGGFTGFMGNAGIYIAEILLFIAIGISVLFAIYQMATNFNESKKALVGIAGLAVVMLIGYALAGSEVPAYAAEKGITGGQFRFIGALVNTAIIATAIVAVYIVIDVLMSIVRN
jgi:hypothetical protein